MTWLNSQLKEIDPISYQYSVEDTELYIGDKFGDSYWNELLKTIEKSNWIKQKTEKELLNEKITLKQMEKRLEYYLKVNNIDTRPMWGGRDFHKYELTIRIRRLKDRYPESYKEYTKDLDDYKNGKITMKTLKLKIGNRLVYKHGI
jgi:hypothetical protein